MLLVSKNIEKEKQKSFSTKIISVSSIADRLEVINYLNIKPRRILKGHQAKVLCSNWSPDKRHIVSSSQDGKLIIWDAFSTNKVSSSGDENVVINSSKL